MLPILAFLALWAPILETAPAPVPVRQDAQEVVLDQLEAALLGKSPENLVRALARSAKIRDLRVPRASTLALNNNSLRVQAAALEALRFNPHPKALPALHTLFKAKQGFSGRDELMGLLLLATAQHGDRSSLPLIAKGGFVNVPAPVLRARILGLGHITSKLSVAALMGGMKSMPRTERMLHMDEFRLALTHLTTEDRGLSARDWIRWWDETGAEVRLRGAGNNPSALLQNEWEAYWSRPTELPRTKPKLKGSRRARAPRPKPKSKPVEAGAKQEGADSETTTPAGEDKPETEDQQEPNPEGAGKPVKDSPLESQEGASAP